MTNPDLTHIAIVLDRSGSMGTILADTIGSFNTFLAEQQKLPGKAHVTLVLFAGTPMVIHHGVPIEHVVPLTTETYRPTGGTALLDAVGETIDLIGKVFVERAEKDRPGKVLVMILTDGEENQSRHFNVDQIRSKIKHQQDAYSWQFVFLGASLDAVKTAASMGIGGAHAMAYTASGQGMHTVTRSLNMHIAAYRSSPNAEVGAQAMSFSDDERTENAPKATP